LRIGIDYQDLEVVGSKRSSEVDSGGSFADTTFLVGNGDYAAQAAMLPRMKFRVKFHVKQQARDGFSGRFT
jgi:hypothetical protein